MVEEPVDLEVVPELDSEVFESRPGCILVNLVEGSSFEEGLDPLCLNRMLKIDSDVDSLEVCRNTD